MKGGAGETGIFMLFLGAKDHCFVFKASFARYLFSMMCLLDNSTNKLLETHKEIWPRISSALGWKIVTS